jgi:NAD(P)-dependent dehydrogenase (short-subunit alcohol dehydrogenase family)
MKTAIITGASVGIGAAAAARFQAGGFNVFNLSRRPCPVAGVTSLATDLGDATAIEAAIAELRPSVDGASEVALVHNACQMLKDSAIDCPDEHLRASLQTNVIAANTINRALLGQMPAGSSVLYVGSTLSEKAVPNSFSYVISKHAVAGMMKATCQDLMGTGIHTACICPGFTDTEMLRTHLGNDQALIESIASLNSFNRLIDPDEIASLIEWAHQNPVINGAVLHAHLGQREA